MAHLLFSLRTRQSSCLIVSHFSLWLIWLKNTLFVQSKTGSKRSLPTDNERFSRCYRSALNGMFRKCRHLFPFRQPVRLSVSIPQLPRVRLVHSRVFCLHCRFPFADEFGICFFRVFLGQFLTHSLCQIFCVSDLLLCRFALRFFLHQSSAGNPH